MTLRILDLFSGIGGFSLGLERAGMRTVAFCEINPYCRKVLAKHWPGVPTYDDVRTLGAERLVRDRIDTIDLICGGFPCQDISVAGKGAGIAGERSGLWKEYARIIGELRPRFVVVENVAALLGRGLDIVLGDLAALGFDAEWHCIPASAVGAPHRRDRVWIIADASAAERRSLGGPCGRMARSDGLPSRKEGPGGFAGVSFSTADTAQMLGPAFFREQSDRALRGYWPQTWPEYLEAVRGVDDGVSRSVDGLAALGNAVVPQIPEMIGRAIIASMVNDTP